MIVNRTVKGRIEILRFYKEFRRYEKFVCVINRNYADLTVIKTVNNKESD